MDESGQDDAPSDEDAAELAMMFNALRDYVRDPATYHVTREGRSVSISPARRFGDDLQMGTTANPPRPFLAR